MKTKQIAVAAVAAFAAISAQAAIDGNITVVSRVAGKGTGGAAYVGGPTGGGAFLVTINSGLGAVENLVNSSPKQFLTFCIERDETFYWGTPYDVSYNTEAVGGGILPAGNDPISAATAWLFERFSNGTLSTAVPAFAVGSSDARHNELQAAIWFLEQEIDGDPASPNASYAYLVDAAMVGTSTSAGDYATAKSKLPGASSLVRVLNTGVSNQDFLVVVPEPSTYIAGGLALLPLLFGLRYRIARR